jgi:Questin oxidase-like
LPEDDRRCGEVMPLAQAVRSVPIVPPERRLRGNITAALAVLGEFPQFLPVIGWFGSDGPIEPQIAQLTEVFARVYLANARDIPTAIAFIHAVTSPSALGNIVPHLEQATARSLLRYAWQSCSALYACYGSGSAFVDDLPSCDKSAEELAAQAVGHGDEHVIKFTEACLGRHGIAASAAYLAAADHVAKVVPRRRSA